MILILVFITVVKLTLTAKSDFKVTQENLLLDYNDKSLIMVNEMGVYKLNRTMNGLKVNFTLLTELDEFSMAWIKAYKFLSNTYRLTAVQSVVPVVVMLKASYLDLDTLFLKHTKPPLTWPVKTKVPYVMRGWFPDSSKIPPNPLDGRWKIQTTIVLGNQRKVCEFSWYLKTEFILRWT